MPKVTDYSAATRFDSGDVIIKDGTDGTKKMTAENAAVEFAGLVSAINHRNVYRGKNLGSSVTAARQLFKMELLTTCLSEIIGVMAV